jgi:hypothetical protein
MACRHFLPEEEGPRFRFNFHVQDAILERRANCHCAAKRLNRGPHALGRTFDLDVFFRLEQVCHRAQVSLQAIDGFAQP